MDANEREKLIPLSAVADLAWLPRRPHIATLHRWATSGRNGRVLRTVDGVGGKATTEGWVWSFFEGKPTEMPSAPTTTRRRREIARAAAVLDAAGI